MDERGEIIWRILFSVIMAGLLLAVLVAYFQSQKRAEIGREARDLVDDLSRSSFSILSGGQRPYDLPEAVGGAPYELAVDEDRNAIVVRITGGSQKGVEYVGVVDADIQVHSIPSSGKVLYITENRGKIVFSKSPLQLPGKEISYPPTEKPDFYEFAKKNTKEASAIGASYFWALNHYPKKENLDVREYKWEGSNTLLTQITSERGPLTVVRVSGHENDSDVGVVDRSWIIHQVENRGGNISGRTNPSIKEAYENGWFYSPKQIIEYLQTRSWERTKNERTKVEIPTAPDNFGATSTTKVGTYPTYLIKFGNYVIYFRAMPWYWSEDQPGFVFQSEPKLEPST